MSATALFLACRHRVSPRKAFLAVLVAIAFDLVGGVVAAALMGALRGVKA